MSLQMAFPIVVVLVAVALAVAKWHDYARADLDRLRQQEYWVKRFAVGTRVLLNDHRVPDHLLISLYGMTKILLDPGTTKVLHGIYTRRSSPEYVAPKWDDDDYNFCANDDKLSEAVSDALYSALMAATYNSLAWGEQTRAMVAHLSRGTPNVAVIANVAVRESRGFDATASDLIAA